MQMLVAVGLLQAALSTIGVVSEARSAHVADVESPCLKSREVRAPVRGRVVYDLINTHSKQ